MIDGHLSLALSVQSNPGVYALLLGSGVSRASGIPTGWEIVLDLIKKLARMSGEECAPDPETWYTTKFGDAPNYSNLLSEVTKTSAERMQLLRSYFEPNEEEREQGQKMPTVAHRSIAELVAKGYFRVIVTTNFDRLMEQALIDAGIQPVVVSTADAAKGALPLVHSRCTIVKVSGDYLDSRLKNSVEELARYDGPINRLLDRIFEEYGLIVCGWSGDWDTALRDAIQRCGSRRFTTYWTSRKVPSGNCETLIDFRKAVVLDIGSSDQFFKDLSEKISVIESMNVADPISINVAIARMKKYLAQDDQVINLRDLVARETERAFKVFNGDRYGSISSYQELFARMKDYENEIDLLLQFLICGAYWGKPSHDPILLQSFRRFADTEALRPGRSVAEYNRYPALLLLYGMGIASIARYNFRFLKSLLYGKVFVRYQEEEKPAVQVLCHSDVVDWDIQRALPGFLKRRTALSDYLVAHLREPLREYLPDESRYEDAFDHFEYLLCLSRADSERTRTDLKETADQAPDFTIWVPVGRFVWRTRNSDRDIVTQLNINEGNTWPESVTLMLAADFFEFYPTKLPDKYLAVKAGVDRHIAAVRREIW